MTRILYGISTIVLILGLQGCFSTQSIQLDKNIHQLKNKSLTYVKSKSRLNVMTPFKAIASGFQKDGSYQKNIVDNLYNDNNGTFSIANYMSVNIAKDMSTKYSLILNAANNADTSHYSIEDFASKLADSDYIIDIYVFNWNVMYYKFRFGKYYITLISRMRLIDTKTKKVISFGFCQKETQYDENNPLTYDRLFKNHAKGLIEETKKLSDNCLNQYKKLLNI